MLRQKRKWIKQEEAASTQEHIRELTVGQVTGLSTQDSKAATANNIPKKKRIQFLREVSTILQSLKK